MSDHSVPTSQAIGDATAAAVVPLQSLLMLLIKHSVIPKDELVAEINRLIRYADTREDAPVLKQTWENLLAAIEDRPLSHDGD